MLARLQRGQLQRGRRGLAAGACQRGLDRVDGARGRRAIGNGREQRRARRRDADLALCAVAAQVVKAQPCLQRILRGTRRIVQRLELRGIALLLGQQRGEAIRRDLHGFERLAVDAHDKVGAALDDGIARCHRIARQRLLGPVGDLHAQRLGIGVEHAHERRTGGRSRRVELCERAFGGHAVGGCQRTSGDGNSAQRGAPGGRERGGGTGHATSPVVRAGWGRVGARLSRYICSSFLRSALSVCVVGKPWQTSSSDGTM
ncbi:hypothetical protein SDC9_71165 [bioreactor metagenome]|uniref:Uncharacterized protein n=1 Tax=bioreactor metagenome TaxID=1076179 RepID=A0A644Y9U5_9ZZZZ